jgi:hypothetical protein
MPNADILDSSIIQEENFQKFTFSETLETPRPEALIPD